jgi:hypothetical protein
VASATTATTSSLFWGGACDALIYPEDVAFFTDEERETWRAEIAAKMARRRPAGFAAWPNEGGDDGDDL